MRARPIATTVVLTSSIVSAACDGAIRVRGRVVDAAGAPVPAAQIHLEPTREGRQFDGVAASDGCFTIARVVAPGRYHYLLRVSAAGFKPVDGVIPTIQDNRTIVVLRTQSDSVRSSMATAAGTWPNNAAVPCEAVFCGAVPCGASDEQTKRQ